MEKADVKIVLIGEGYQHRSFNGANKALPVLASALNNAGYKNVIQMDFERKDVTVEGIIKESRTANLIAFAGVTSPQLNDVDIHVRAIHSYLQNIRRNIPIIVGGYAAKGIDKDVLEHIPVTAFFDGEGEKGIVQIAQSLERGTFENEMSDIQGLCFIDKNGKFHKSTAQRTENFDDIDQNFGLVHIPEKYDMNIFVRNGRQLKTAQLFTQRGCPYRCGYCNKSTETSRVVFLGEESLRNQLEKLKKEGYEAIYIDVDTFTISPERAKLEAELFRQYGFVWGSNTRIDRINRELIEYFVSNNCVYMFFGVEHILPEVLLAIGKFNIKCNAVPLKDQLEKAEKYKERVERVFREMTSAGLPSSYFIILGLPKAILNDDETEIIGYRPTTLEEDIEAIRFGIEECNPDYINLNVLRFMPGTLAAEQDPAYFCVKPTKDKPIMARHFLPKIAPPLSINHPVYRLCESVGKYQPITTAVDPERVYKTIKATLQIINRNIDRGGKKTVLLTDEELLKLGLITRDPDGKYSIAPLKEFESLKMEDFA